MPRRRPRRKGFRGKTKCPLALLDISDAIVIPLADGRRQTNPLYGAPPGSHPKGDQLIVPHWDGELRSNEFKIAYAYGSCFLYAKAQWPDATQSAYVNVWAGRRLGGWGTLFCSLAHRPNCERCCLCGSCRLDWQQRGWLCKYLSW